MAFATEEEKKKNAAGLPTVESASQEATKTVKSTQKALQPIGEQLDALSQERLQDHHADLNRYKLFVGDETDARGQAAQANAALRSDLQNELDALAEAEAMNPLIRGVRAIVDQSVKPSVIRKRIAAKERRLSLADAAEARRQQRASFQLNNMVRIDALEEQGFALREERLKTQMAFLSQNAQASKDMFNTAIAASKFQIESRKEQTHLRAETLERMNTANLVALHEEVQVTETGMLDAGNGVMITQQDIEREQQRRKDTELNLRQLAMTVESQDLELIVAQEQRVLENMTEAELASVQQNNFTIQDGKGGVIPLAPAAVQAEMQKRSEVNKKLATQTAEDIIAETDALTTVTHVQNTINGMTSRLAQAFGMNSQVTRDIGFESVKLGYSMAALTGVDNPDKIRPEDIARVSTEGLSKLGSHADKGLKTIEAKIDEAAKLKFPKSEAGQAATKAFIQQVDLNPSTAAEVLILQSVGAAPVEASLDPKTAAAMEAIKLETATWLQNELKDSFDVSLLTNDDGSMNTQLLTQVVLKDLVDSRTGRIKPEHAGLQQRVSAVAYAAWRTGAANEAMLSSVNHPDSPMFGRVTPSQLQTAIQAGERYINSREIPANQRGYLAARETMRVLRGIPVGDGKSAADLMGEHMQSKAFLETLEQISSGTQQGFVGFLLNKSAIQGNFTTDMLRVAEAYQIGNSDTQMQALEKQAKLTSLAENPNNAKILAYKLAGYLEANADPTAVNQYIDSLVNMYGVDAEKIWEHINTAREHRAEQESARKAMLKNWGQSFSVLTSIIDALESVAPAGTLRANPASADNANQTQALVRAGIREQREDTIFPEVKE